MNGKRIVMVILAIAPLLALLAVYHELPDMVPLQWGTDGVSRYGKKWELIPFAGMNVLIGVLMPLCAKIDPKRKNYARFSETYDTLTLTIMVFMAVIIGITLVETLQPGTLPVVRLVNGLVGLLLILVGNKMPKVKRNFFTGVKTPWALSSDTVWNKTQRLGGQAFFFGGLAILVCAFFVPLHWMGEVVLAVVILVCILPTVMSYVWYQKEWKEFEKHSE
ncbi:SdpI family protein [Anaerotignum sp.]